MIEECFMAAAMTICFALPTYFLVLPGGNFAVLFLTSVISLADGIGELGPSHGHLISCWILIVHHLMHSRSCKICP